MSVVGAANQTLPISVNGPLKSVMLNLGEGSAYPIGSASQQRFFRIARASVIEVECALECAITLGWCDAATLDARSRAGRAARLAISVCR